jgi:anti-sigma regulatory factor (Ser/Thr protein kinase)
MSVMSQMPATASPWHHLETYLEIAALPTAPGCARGHVRSVAAEWGLAGLAEVAELLVSELVTNAVRASEHMRARADMAAVPVVRLWLTSDGLCLLVHVWDDGAGIPARRNGAPDEECGRGLMLVEALGKEWGSYPKDVGKMVWVLIGGP